MSDSGMDIPVKRGRGRPTGSKNRKTLDREKALENEQAETGEIAEPPEEPPFALDVDFASEVLPAEELVLSEPEEPKPKRKQKVSMEEPEPPKRKRKPKVAMKPPEPTAPTLKIEPRDHMAIMREALRNCEAQRRMDRTNRYDNYFRV